MKEDRAYFTIKYLTEEKKFVRWELPRNFSDGTRFGYSPDQVTEEYKMLYEKTNNNLKKYNKGKDINFGFIFVKVIRILYNYHAEFNEFRKRQLSQQVKYSHEYLWKTTYNVFSFENDQIIETQHVENYPVPMEMVGLDNEQAKSYIQSVVADNTEIVSVEVICK